MENFRYNGLNGAGERVPGTEEAGSRNAAPPRVALNGDTDP